MPHTPYTPIDTDRIRTTNADLDRRWRTLKAELDAQHARYGADDIGHAQDS